MNIYINHIDSNLLGKLASIFFIKETRTFIPISSVYTNVKELHNKELMTCSIVYCENTSNFTEFIFEKDIHICFTNVLSSNIMKINKTNFYICTIKKFDYKNVYFYKDLYHIIKKYNTDIPLCKENENNCNQDVSMNSDNIETPQLLLDNNVNISLHETTESVKLNNIPLHFHDNKIRILIHNISKHSVDKIFSDIYQTKNVYLNIANCFTDTHLHDTVFYDIPIIFVTIKDITEFISNNKINMLLTNCVSSKLINSIKDQCLIFTMTKNTNNPNLYYYKTLPSILSLLSNPSQGVSHIESDTKHEDNNPKTVINVNPKDNYRKICSSYISQITKIKVPELYLNLDKEAVLVEHRQLPHLEVLLRNMIYNLGNTWSYTIICGKNNIHEISRFCKKISKNIKIINTYKDNITQNEYNNWLCTSEFWDLFVGEKILIYQEDTCIFKEIPDTFLNYDYVGAPFGPECVSPVNVGNGGFSLRTKSVMKEVIKRYPATNFKTSKSFINNYKNAKKLDLYPEDNYFPQIMQELKIGEVAPYEVAKQFSSEHVFTEGCIGMHCMWFCNKKWENYVINYFESIFMEQHKQTTDYKIVKKYDINYPKHDLDIYIIHCDDFKDREPIINKAITQLKKEGNKNINMFNSVNTSTCDLALENQIQILQKYDINLKFNNSAKFKFYKSGQIGCYLGHHLAIKHILEKFTNSQTSSNYSIVFEDDIILEENFTNSVMKILHHFENTNEHFDIIYLGHLNDNRGMLKYDNIYKLNKLLWNFGAHGMLINNKSVVELYKYNCNILHEIDNHYKILFNRDLINAYYIDKPLVKQNREIFSYINSKTNNN
jgi:GR25 family glycosyltransferase involved in LPS biosynthesis